MTKHYIHTNFPWLDIKYITHPIKILHIPLIARYYVLFQLEENYNNTSDGIAMTQCVLCRCEMFKNEAHYLICIIGWIRKKETQMKMLILKLFNSNTSTYCVEIAIAKPQNILLTNICISLFLPYHLQESTIENALKHLSQGN